MNIFYIRHELLCGRDTLDLPSVRSIEEPSIPNPILLDEYKEEVVNGLRKDDVAMFIRGDRYILLCGQNQYLTKRKGAEKSQEMRKSVREWMRLWARLYLAVKQANDDQVRFLLIRS